MGSQTIDSRRIKWTGKDGETTAIMTVSLERRVDTVGRDEWTGENVSRDGGLEIRYVGSAEGYGMLDRGIVRDGPMVPNDCAAITAGGKMGIPADALERIDAAAEELRQHPEWLAQQERRDEMAAHEAKRDAVRHHMDDDAYPQT